MEKYSSGRRGAPAKGVGRVTGAEVQIFSSPPKQKRQDLCLSFLFCLRRIWTTTRRVLPARKERARPPSGKGAGRAKEWQSSQNTTVTWQGQCDAETTTVQRNACVPRTSSLLRQIKKDTFWCPFLFIANLKLYHNTAYAVFFILFQGRFL